MRRSFKLGSMKLARRLASGNLTERDRRSILVHLRVPRSEQLPGLASQPCSNTRAGVLRESVLHGPASWTDAHGNIQYHKPSYTIKSDGRVIQTDAHGNKLYHKQQYLITNNKIVPVNAYGKRQYNKPALVIESGKKN